MRYTHAFFDFDGTIADSSRGIKRCVRHALSKFGIDEHDDDVLRRFIGPPLEDMFEKIYGFTREQAEQAVLYYREEYVDKGLYETKIYDGISELLEQLTNAGVVCAIASNKPTDMIKRMLGVFGLEKHIAYISGLQPGVATKTAAIEMLLDRLSLDESRGSCVMIGDRCYDAEGALNCGLPFIAAEFGFGIREEFEGYPVALYAKNPAEIGEFVLG